MRKIFLILGMCFALLSSAYAQQKVTGTVTDEDGAGIPGVSIIQKGTSRGTITNIDGEYSIDVPGEATLVFEFVGMKDVEEQVTNRSVIDVTMVVDAVGIDEVVVTALGIKREVKALGYAMTEVKGEDIVSANTVNPVLALQGKSAGLSIGASDGGLTGNSKIQIRGVSVLNSNNNQPIFVIDGVIVENGISNASADWSGNANDFGNILKNLNPDDYESVSVLKGAAATALYGSRGINGAIVIKNKDGRGRKGLGVKVTQSVGIDHVYKIPDMQFEYGPGTLAGYVGYGEKDENGNYYKFDVTQAYTRDINGQQVMTKIGNPNGDGFLWGPKYDGRPIEDYDGVIRTYEGYPDAMLDAYDTGLSTNTAVALNGASDKGSFYLSNSYNKREGTGPTNEFDRYSLLFKGSYNLASWLRADASVSFTNSKVTNPGNDLATSYVFSNWAGWYDTKRWKNRDVWQASHGGTPNGNYGDEYANVPGNSTWFNYYLDSQVREEQVTRPIVRLTADLTDWMSVTAEANMNDYTTFYENKDLGTGYAMEGGSYQIRHDRDVSRTGKLVVNMSKEFGDFNVNAMVGGELWDQEKSFSRTWTNGGLIVPGKFYMANSKQTLGTEAKVFGTKQVNSLYFLGSVSWREQLFLDITGRNDWSSALVYTDGTGNYSYFYPSVSGSWLFTETFALPSAFSFGKLRASWAQVGNDTNPYDINRGYGLGNWEVESGNVYLNTKSTTLVDPNIKPERKNSFEIGADVRLFENRLSADVAYYNEAITNQISTVPLPSESGLSNMLTNVGTLTNSGFELTLGFTPVRTKDFEWESTFNYWHNKTVVSDLVDEVGEYKSLAGYVNYGNFRVGSVAFEDGEYGVLMSDTKPKEDANGNKILTWRSGQHSAVLTRSYEVQEVGKINPDFEGSWDNTFRYKNLSLSVLLDARFGGHIASFNNKYGTAYGMMETSLVYRDEEHGGMTWTSQYPDSEGQTFHDGMIPDGVFADGQEVVTPLGETVNVGGMSYQEAYEAGYVEPTHASIWTYFNSAWSSGVVNDNWFNEVKYIALRNISIGYNLPKSLAQRIKAQNLYVSLNARNIGYLYNSLPNHLNPESFRGTSSSASYYERSFTPYTATYTMSVSIDF
ncbi:SusC/RagA family TonB-linked outer membrane protein [Prolixibacteraceae bacterium Z1-6]|uniref:SusC/RagA family TonB-linked outer membrane protein n=1 Tax=Draconibacterium aestuarii TaxID=2998507 RepID=A0A9X3FBF7_9BACT|nr:SusC/RagA family TonB-linked outer membrane protein [Prolixibacteraceae bacterium Z1-6]